MEEGKSILVKARVKEILKDINVRKEYYPALEKKVFALIEESKQRALLNGRKSILARDV